jgi:hypothetical protein
MVTLDRLFTDRSRLLPRVERVRDLSVIRIPWRGFAPHRGLPRREDRLELGDGRYDREAREFAGQALLGIVGDLRPDERAAWRSGSL